MAIGAIIGDAWWTSTVCFLREDNTQSPQPNTVETDICLAINSIRLRVRKNCIMIIPSVFYPSTRLEYDIFPKQTAAQLMFDSFESFQ